MRLATHMTALLAGAALLACGGSAAADETFSGPGGPLVDHDGTNNGVASFTINVSGFPEVSVASLRSLTFTNLTHTWLGDLVIALIPPDGVGSFVTVTSPPALHNGNLNGTYSFVVDVVQPFQFQTLDEASEPLGDDDVVPSGTFAASDWGEGDLGPRVDWNEMQGATLDGAWVVQFHDFFEGDTGALGGWSFTVSIPEPAGVALLSVCGVWLLRRRARPS